MANSRRRVSISIEHVVVRVALACVLHLDVLHGPLNDLPIELPDYEGVRNCQVEPADATYRRRRVRQCGAARGDRLRANDWDDPERCPIGVEQHCPLTLSIVAFGVHQYVPAEIERTLRADCHVGDLDMRHPLERKVGIPRATPAHADDGRASVVHQILSPKRILTRAEYTRVEAQLSLVLGDGDVRAKYSADARDGFAHG